MNPSCRATKVSWTLEPNNSVTRQRCSSSSSKPGWTNWVKSLVQWSFKFGVTDDNRWKTSNSRSLCSRFKRVAYPERILIATCTLSLEDSAYLIMRHENERESYMQSRASQTLEVVPKPNFARRVKRQSGPSVSPGPPWNQPKPSDAGNPRGSSEKVKRGISCFSLALGFILETEDARRIRSTREIATDDWYKRRKSIFEKRGFEFCMPLFGCVQVWDFLAEGKIKDVLCWNSFLLRHRS